MAALEQVVSGEWFEIRERLHRPLDLLTHLFKAATTSVALAEVADELEASIEGGVFEFRRTVLSRLYDSLAEAEFSSEIFGQLDELEERVRAILAATAYTRALLTQDVEFELERDLEDDDADAAASAREQEDINRIIGDVKEILASDPSARMNAAMKNIMLQLQKYREEAATYKKLKEQATGYRLEMYSRTFAATFQQIFESIRKNYGQFVEEREEAARAARPSVVQNLDTRAWARAMTGQLEEISYLRATLMFARNEHSGMREPLVRLARRKDGVLKLLDEEIRHAADAAGSEEAARRLSRILAREVAYQLRDWLR